MIEKRPPPAMVRPGSSTVSVRSVCGKVTAKLDHLFSRHIETFARHDDVAEGIDQHVLAEVVDIFPPAGFLDRQPDFAGCTAGARIKISGLHSDVSHFRSFREWNRRNRS